VQAREPGLKVGGACLAAHESHFKPRSSSIRSGGDGLSCGAGAGDNPAAGTQQLAADEGCVCMGSMFVPVGCYATKYLDWGMVFV